MSGAAVVDPTAIEEVARALVRYGDAEEAVMAQVEAAIRAARGRARSEQQRRRGELDGAEAALRACLGMKDANCSDQHAAVRRARARLEDAEQAVRQVEAAAARYQAVRAKHNATVQSLVQNGRSHLNRKARDISAYLGGGQGGGSGAGGGAGGSASGAGPSRGAQRGVLDMIAKAAAKEIPKALALPLLMQGVGMINPNLDAPGVDDLIEQAIETVRLPGFGPAVAGNVSHALRFDDLGAAMSQMRDRLRGQ